MDDSSMCRVAIVILNWNGLNNTLACLSSVYESDYKNFQVIVIDNNSNNDELNIIKQNFPEIVGIQSQTNLGFAGGCNLGMKFAMQNEFEFVWLLNNDAIVFPDTLTKLINKMQADATIGMISPVIYDKSQQHIFHCGTVIHPETLRRKEIITPQDFSAVEKETPAQICLWGTALLIRRDLIEKIGFLDEQYFAYFEDTDFSIRAITSGSRNSVDIESKVLHGEAVVKKNDHHYFYMARNEYLLIKRHSPEKYRNYNVRNYMSRTLSRSAAFKKIGEFEKSKICLDGMWNAFRNNFGEWTNRKSMPTYLSKLLLWHPYFLSYLISRI